MPDTLWARLTGSALNASCSFSPSFQSGTDSHMNIHSMGERYLFPSMFQWHKLAETYCNDYERLNFPALVPIVFPAETRKHNSSSLRCEESCPNEGAREEEQAERASGAARSRRSPCTLTHPQPQTGGRRGGHSQAQLAAAQKQASKRRKQKEGRNREGRKEAHNAAVDDYRRKLASDGQVRRRRRRCLRVRAQNWRFPTKCSTK